MVIINRETDYAIRILRSIKHGQIRNVSSICDEQSIKKPFAYKIIKRLNDNGLIEVERGKMGGISLLCNPDETSLYDIMNALDNTSYVNECFRPGYDCEYACKGQMCKTHSRLANLQENVDKALSEVKLRDLI